MNEMVNVERQYAADALQRAPGYVKGKTPERLDDISFDDELELMYGRKWGCPSKIGKLHTVLLSRPSTAEMNTVTCEDPVYFLYNGKHGVPGFGFPEGPEDFPDLALMRKQHDGYAKVLQENGVEIIYANLPDRMAGIYLPYRGAGYPPPLMLRNGCVIGRSALAWKRGQEAIWMRKMVEIGVPILYTITGRGIWEGRIDWLDPHHCLLGVGHRGNMDGFRQLEWILKESGVKEVIPVQLPSIFKTHLDICFTMVAERLALCYTPIFPYDTLKYIERKGVRIIDIPKDEMRYVPANAFPLEPGRVVIPKGPEKTIKMLNQAGVQTIEIDISESLKLGAGPDCMTLALIREEGPYL
jgi:N-dimethylarginine dimethylaminohydrolase